MYLIFCITTATFALLDIMFPIISQMTNENNTNNSVYENKFISYLTFFTLTMLLTPIMFFVAIIPSMSDKFKTGLFNSLTNSH